jgi:GDPmannose 4,6-dehydratase
MKIEGKTALITGITGQDGSYLAEFLLSKGYKVYGMYRRSSTDGNFERIFHLRGKIDLLCGEMSDIGSLTRIIQKTTPHEIYNLASQSQVALSFTQEHYTNEVNWLGVERLLEVINEISPTSKVYQASTSELFGVTQEPSQSEKTPFNPVSPYAKAKLKAHRAIEREREKGMFACAGILFNHESPRRGLEFVTRKVTDGLSRIKIGIPQRESGQDYLELGNLEAKRDWGHSKDYVRAMWLMLQQKSPKDYIISSGESHSIREFVNLTAENLEMKINWGGEGLNEIGYDLKGKEIIRINKDFFRPAEVWALNGDSTLAKKELGWSPEITFENLVKEMAIEDLKKMQKISHENI